MTREVRLQDLHVRQLQYLFSPPGLPLVRKGGDSGGLTTTILVRGEAGAGKTTLALALAHAIAASREGAVLVLSSETSPIEYDFKAELVRIERPQAIPWDGRARAERGSLIVQHIALTREPGDDGSVDESPSLLDVVWGLVRTHEEEDHATKVTAVLIDGVLLAGEGTTTQRSETAAFLQALEARGISTVLVEESSPQQVSWLPFVVDVVFELQYATDAASGRLTRQLVCRKSRYAPAIAGPHDYDLDDDEVLAVWPDPLDLRPQDLRALWPASVPSPTFFWPLQEKGKCWVWSGGGLVAATKASELDAVSSMMWGGPVLRAALCWWDEFPAQGPCVSFPARGGVYAFAWRAIAAAKNQAINALRIDPLDGLFARSSSRIGVHRCIRALQRFGLIVGARGSKDEVERIRPLAQLGPTNGHAAGVREVSQRRLAAIERWLSTPRLDLVLTGRELDTLRDQCPTQGEFEAIARNGLQEPIVPDQLERLPGVLEKLAQMHLPCAALAGLIYAFWANRSAPSFQWRGLDLHDSSMSDPRVSTVAAVVWYVWGDDWMSARASLRPGELTDLTGAMWRGLTLIHSPKPVSKDICDSILAGDTPSDLVTAMLARACAAHGDLQGAFQLVEEYAKDRTTWERKRWCAELSAEYGTEEQRVAAGKEMLALASDESAPALQRAEMFYNIAVLLSESRPSDVVEHVLQAAEALNPLIKDAADALRVR